MAQAVVGAIAWRGRARRWLQRRHIRGRVCVACRANRLHHRWLARNGNGADVGQLVGNVFLQRHQVRPLLDPAIKAQHLVPKRVAPTLATRKLHGAWHGQRLHACLQNLPVGVGAGRHHGQHMLGAAAARRRLHASAIQAGLQGWGTEKLPLGKVRTALVTPGAQAARVCLGFVAHMRQVRCAQMAKSECDSVWRSV